MRIGIRIGGERVKFRGERYQVSGSVSIDDAPRPVPVLLGALGPQMLRLAGRLTAGTVTWLAGMHTLENHIVPTISDAANDSGRPSPRIVAGLPILLTDDVGGTRAKLNEKLAFYDTMPSYRAMLDREGVSTAADVAIIGDERVLDDALTRLRDIGITDFRLEKRDLSYKGN